MIKRQGKAGIAAGRSGIRIPANSAVISGVRCAEEEEKGGMGALTRGAGASEAGCTRRAEALAGGPAIRGVDAG